MWNCFEEAKEILRMQYKQYDWKNGLGPEELRQRCEKLIEQYEPISTEKAKAEVIACILKNARLCIHPEEIFADKISHVGFMFGFLWGRAERLGTREEKCINQLLAFPEEAFAFTANMDFGHVAPDWNYILGRGIVGIIEDLETQKQTNSQKANYYDNRLLVYRAIKDCFLRLVELAESFDNEKGRFIAENLRQLTVSAPQTLAQAMQLTLLFYNFQTNLDVVTIRSLGGLDRLFYPYYKADLESGRYTKEQLEEITTYFLWKINAMGVIANLPFYICGMNEKGKDASNEYTMVLLEQYRKLDIYDPKMHVLYHENMNSQVLKYILEMIREGKNSFVFMNTNLMSKSLEKLGITSEDAKKVIVYGCYEGAAEGTEVPCTCAGMINMAKSLEFSLERGREFTSFNMFYEDVIQHLVHYTTVCMDTIAHYEKHYDEVCPSMIMSPTYQASRETGVDVYSGGAKYNNTSIVGAGMATLVDSLIAVKHVVFEEELKTMHEFKNILASNWEDDRRLQHLIMNKYPKFGNSQKEADDLAVDIYNRYCDCINGRPNGRNGVFRAGLFSVDWRFGMGKQMGATPDGRYAEAPISKNLASVIGQDRNGVTAYLNSLLRFDATKVSDGYVADVVLHHSAVKCEEGMRAFEGLLSTFMSEGGFSVHFNILSPDVLVNAQREPDKYQNLQVRLCGWNVQFVNLSKEEQDEFIKQSENSM